MTARFPPSFSILLVQLWLTALSYAQYTSGNTWTNLPLPAQSSSFTIQWEAVPAQANLDGVMALSNASSTAFTSLSAIVRFTTAGTFDARNGNVYAASNVLNYTAGTTYHFLLTVDPAAEKYSAVVTPAGGAAVTIADNFSFRASTREIKNLAFVITGTGSHSLGNLLLNGNALVQAPAAPMNLRIVGTGTNLFPSVDAGPDQSLTLPADSTTLTATANDSDGTIATRSWAKISGGSAAMTGTSTNTLALTALAAGSYLFEFTATDNKGASASDQVRVDVTGPPSGAKQILFVIGGSNTAGFLEGNSTTGRDEHRAAIDNFSNTSGNHGWGELATELESAGYELVQMAEGSGGTSGNLNVGAPLPFDTMNLSQYAAIVMGSNNARYTEAQVDAIEAFVRGGGGVAFISDANFGGSWDGLADTGWRDASNSDQQFLDRFGLLMNQDRGTYAASRSSGHFLDPDHPLVANGVNQIHGEGVTPISIGTPVEGVHTEIIVRVPSGQSVGVNTPPFSSGRGRSRASTANDGVVAIALAGAGRVVGHFDRNTFFNNRGAGSSITRYDHRQYALNLFAWLTSARD